MSSVANMTDPTQPRNDDFAQEFDLAGEGLSTPLRSDEGPTCNESVGPRSWEEAKRRGLDVSLGMKPEDFQN